MALSPDLQHAIDMTTQAFPDGVGLVSEIERVKAAIHNVDEVLQDLPAQALRTLDLSQLMIRNGTELTMMSESDLLQEIANVTAGIIRCDELLEDTAEPDAALSESLTTLAKELQISSVKEASTDDDQIYCLCRLRYSATRSMIQCDFCDNWYHLICTGLSLLAIPTTYQCPLCQDSNTRKRRHLDPADIPDNIVQPEVDLKLCAKGMGWLQGEISKTESEIAEVVVEIEGVAHELVAAEKADRNRASRAARKLAKEHMEEKTEAETEDGADEVDNRKTPQGRRSKRRR